ncbi:MAG: DUF4147 domain-containing protein [Thermoplasmatota archaeon]
MIESIQAAFLGALDAEHPTKQVKHWIRGGHLDDFLGDRERPATIHAFAAGKAAATMAWGLAETNVPLKGHAVVPHGTPTPAIPGLKWHHGAHPLPDEGSFAAGETWWKAAESIPENAPVLLLVGGGASSLVEWPPQSVPLGWEDIAALNEKRREHSVLKGGGFVRKLRERTSRIRGLILPDVPPGQEERVVGSGLAEGADCHVLRGNADFLREFCGLLEAFGMQTSLFQERLTGPLHEQLESFLAAGEPGKLLVGGGECTLPAPADVPGGRCQHAALLAGSLGAELFAALGTDGIDGTTRNAGAWSRADPSPEARDALAQWRATPYLETRGQTIRLGQTGTNVNDVWVLWTAK